MEPRLRPRGRSVELPPGCTDLMRFYAYLRRLLRSSRPKHAIAQAPATEAPRCELPTTIRVVHCDGRIETYELGPDEQVCFSLPDAHTP